MLSNQFDRLFQLFAPPVVRRRKSKSSRYDTGLAMIEQLEQRDLLSAAPPRAMPSAVPVIVESPQSLTVSVGLQATFSASTSTVGATVKWQVSSNGGLTYIDIPNATDTTYSFTVNINQNNYKYRAVFTNVDGSVATGPATLFVLPGASKPLVTLDPLSQTKVAGTTVTFQATASGLPIPTVQWQLSTDNGKTFMVIPGENSTTLTFVTSLDMSGYQYRAVFTNNQGSATTKAATLTVTPLIILPVITLSPVSQTVINGTLVTFTAAATGEPAPNVQWQVSSDLGKTFKNIAGANSTSYSFSATLVQSSNLYRAVFSNYDPIKKTGGTVNTSFAQLVVIDGVTVPQIVLNPISAFVFAGQNVTLVASGSGNPKPTVQWQISTDSGVTFTNITGATSTSYTIAATTLLNGALYRAVFTNSQGSATTTAATLNVFDTALGLVVTKNPVSQLVNGGQAVQFRAAAMSTTTAPRVQWQSSTNGGVTFTNIIGATSTVLTVTTTAALNGTQYRAVFTNLTKTVTTKVASLSVQTAPAIKTQPTAQTVSAGQTATFVAAATGNPAVTVQWQVSTDGGKTYTNVAGATSTTLKVLATAGKNGYLYRAVFKNSLGTAISKGVKLTVN